VFSQKIWKKRELSALCTKDFCPDIGIGLDFLWKIVYNNKKQQIVIERKSAP